MCAYVIYLPVSGIVHIKYQHAFQSGERLSVQQLLLENAQVCLSALESIDSELPNISLLQTAEQFAEIYILINYYFPKYSIGFIVILRKLCFCLFLQTKAFCDCHLFLVFSCRTSHEANCQSWHLHPERDFHYMAQVCMLCVL